MINRSAFVSFVVSGIFVIVLLATFAQLEEVCADLPWGALYVVWILVSLWGILVLSIAGIACVARDNWRFRKWELGLEELLDLPDVEGEE